MCDVYQADHPMKDVSLLAMASLCKLLVVVIKPQLKVLYIRPLVGDPATLPLLAWQFVLIQVTDEHRVLDPVLAFARDQTIYFVQVRCSVGSLWFNAPMLLDSIMKNSPSFPFRFH